MSDTFTGTGGDGDGYDTLSDDQLQELGNSCYHIETSGRWGLEPTRVRAALQSAYLRGQQDERAKHTPERCAIHGREMNGCEMCAYVAAGIWSLDADGLANFKERKADA